MGTAEALGATQEKMLGGAIWIGEDFVVPQAHNRPTFAAQKIGSSPIVGGRFDMLASIKFNCQLGFATR